MTTAYLALNNIQPFIYNYGMAFSVGLYPMSYYHSFYRNITLYIISLKMGNIDLLNVNVSHLKADNIFVRT